MNKIMTKEQEQSEPYEKPHKKNNKIILPIIIIVVISIGSILVANLFFSNPDGPDFKFEAGGYDSEMISFSPPIENA